MDLDAASSGLSTEPRRARGAPHHGQPGIVPADPVGPGTVTPAARGVADDFGPHRPPRAPGLRRTAEHQAFREAGYGVIVVYVMLLGQDGFSVVSELRARGRTN